MKRTLPGILLAAAWVLLLLFGTSQMFYLAMLGVTAIGAGEYLGMTCKTNVTGIDRIYLLLALILPTLFAGQVIGGVDAGDGLFISFFLLSLYFIRRYTHFEDSYERLSRLVFGAVYIGFLASYLVGVRELSEGGGWLVILTAVTAGSDTGAYWCGSTWGRRKLCPGISPKKTVEGALGGLVCGVAAAMVLSGLLLQEVNWFFILAAAVLVTGVGILGDLTESIIKRGTGTKDSGKLLAGHGGVLDRIDSMLLSAPVFYYLLLFMGYA